MCNQYVSNPNALKISIIASCEISRIQLRSRSIRTIRKEASTAPKLKPSFESLILWSKSLDKGDAMPVVVVVARFRNVTIAGRCGCGLVLNF